MQTDVNGRSTCKPGEERHESFRSRITGKTLVQYDYRASDGELFTIIRPTLEECRAKRDEWLRNRSSERSRSLGARRSVEVK